MERKNAGSSQCLGCLSHCVSQSLRCLLLVTILTTSRAGNVNPRLEKYLPDYTVYHNLSRIQSEVEAVVSRNPSYMKASGTCSGLSRGK